ncbi:unnamed protein product [Paramecium primaurelia]|uniref:Uncharacterized protein n=1 Tax=Paramecium primaurelia TaxID=5886 RepID=A0A8S1Q7U5_PARPR|nr:unnamed protein product [Paramecium primaurelia]CAD8111608.1 unnamed protein product [Paramecium primaurelia]
MESQQLSIVKILIQIPYILGVNQQPDNPKFQIDVSLQGIKNCSFEDKVQSEPGLVIEDSDIQILFLGLPIKDKELLYKRG